MRVLCWLLFLSYLLTFNTKESQLAERKGAYSVTLRGEVRSVEVRDFSSSV